MLFESRTIGNVHFYEGYTDDPESAREIMKHGSMLEYREDGSWTYCYYYYHGDVVGIQWEGRSYVGCWISEVDDLMDSGKRNYEEIMNKQSSAKKSESKPKFNDMVQEQREKRIGKASSSDMRDAEIFGQIAGLLSQVSTKNRKNLNVLCDSWNFNRTRDETTISLFERAKSKAESGEKQWV